MSVGVVGPHQVMSTEMSHLHKQTRLSSVSLKIKPFQNRGAVPLAPEILTFN